MNGSRLRPDFTVTGRIWLRLWLCAEWRWLMVSDLASFVALCGVAVADGVGSGFVCGFVRSGGG
jgi:hypothetical protein